MNPARAEGLEMWVEVHGARPVLCIRDEGEAAYDAIELDSYVSYFRRRKRFSQELRLPWPALTVHVAGERREVTGTQSQPEQFAELKPAGGLSVGDVVDFGHGLPKMRVASFAGDTARLVPCES